MAAQLKRILKPFGNSWLVLIQSTAWIAAVIAAFLLPPPVGTEADTKIWVRFAQFVITIILGLLVLLVLRWNRKKHILPWAASAAVSLVLGTIVFFSYQILSARWTAQYDGQPVLIGHTLTPLGAAHLAEFPSLTPSNLIWHTAGDVEKIWTRQSINEHRFLLAGVYILAMPLFTICIISLLQAIQCATTSKPRARRRTPAASPQPPAKPAPLPESK